MGIHYNQGGDLLDYLEDASPFRYKDGFIDPPTGDAALRLWDAVVGWTEFSHLYELQRPKTPADEQRIAETFRPYLQARDWVSINRGEVVTFAAGAQGQPASKEPQGQ